MCRCCASSGGSAGKTLTPSGVVELSAAEASAERVRLESADAFAELVALSSVGSPGAAPAAPAGSPTGLKKPPWLRQRAPQGERCAPAVRNRR